MRFFLTWLLVLGVFAGTFTAVSAHEESGIMECTTQVCGHEHVMKDCTDGDHCPPGEHQDGEKDHPSGDCHHHHHSCCAGPMVPNEVDGDSLNLAHLRLGVSLEGVRVPESPVFELDTPPLI